MALVLSIVLSGAAYQLTRWYLIDKRQDLALREATLNAQVAKGQLPLADGTGATPLEVLQASDARALLRLGDNWYSAVVELDQSAVPVSLREIVDDRGAGRQRTVVNGTPFIVFGFTLDAAADTQYFEFISADEYERTLRVLGTVLAVAATLTTLGGASAGYVLSRRLVRPLNRIAVSAERISRGDLAHRLDPGDDEDLTRVAATFNEMAANVEARIEREHRFTADVSHELRTPLTALGAAVGLARRSTTEERRHVAITAIDEQLQQLTRLTVELLEISRVDAGAARLDLTDVDLVGIVTAVLSQAGVGKDRMHVDRACTGPWRLDGVRIERAIANLVENAQRYGGGVAAVSVRREGDAGSIAVDDAGPGVPEHDRTAIFGRFHRGSAPQPRDMPKGTGLGLSLVDEHVRLHGGTVWVEDSPMGGARFVIRIPGAFACA
jgi:two-component system, OmpR family, sensor histidine kinase MtrB